MFTTYYYDLRDSRFLKINLDELINMKFDLTSLDINSYYDGRSVYVDEIDIWRVRQSYREVHGKDITIDHSNDPIDLSDVDWFNFEIVKPTILAELNELRKELDGTHNCEYISQIEDQMYYLSGLIN